MSTALYRRYRPETFADVIGQEHVTEPLMSALRGDRITHAYLFSGPRGCGKTTSARIFARCLNCEQGPTDTPCGTCPSCVDLARDGAGSLDVVEMDAASHGGVDDARELRERAAFAPARDRYKVFIIDEAHMVTNQGFNALLKLVEEPPPHVKFVFATTEPEKVIGTIRSRTHHYPFRLVPPERLQAYLEELCSAEQVTADSGVLPLVVRAGGGSVRDSLSVLDQLIAGSQDGVIGYERAVALLGYTHATLLDDVVDAIAAVDGAALFRVVDRVIDSGHDPRRFAEDLLVRLRDLIVIAVSGEHAATALRGLPQDQFERMQVQAGQLGPAQLSRASDLVNDALSEMSGATSPRLQLELLCARLLLPAAGDAARGFGARLERIENYLASGREPRGDGQPAAAAADDGGARREQPVVAGPGSRRGEPDRGGGGPADAPGAGRPGAGAPGGDVAERPAADGDGSDAAARGASASGGRTPGGDAEAAQPADSGRPADQPAAPRAGSSGTAAAAAPTTPGAPGAGSSPAEAAEHDSGPGADAGEKARPLDRSADRSDTRRPPAGPDGQRPAASPEGQRPAASPEGQRPAAGRSGTQPSAPGSGEQQRAQPAAPPPAGHGPSADTAHVDAEMVRRRWPEVLSTLARFKRTTWTLVSQNAQVADVSGGVLHLAFTTSGLAHTFRSGPHAESLQRALAETLGVDVRIEPVLSPAAQGGSDRPYASGGAGAPSGRSETDWGGPPPDDEGPPPSSGGTAWSRGSSSWGGAPPRESAESERGPAASEAANRGTREAGASSASAWSSSSAPTSPEPSSTGQGEPASGWSSGGTQRAAQERADRPGAPGTPPGPGATGETTTRSTGPAGPAATDAPGATSPPTDAGSGSSAGPSAASASRPPDGAPRETVRPVAPADDTVSMDDPDAEGSDLIGAPLIEQILGGTVIEEIEE